MSDFEILSTLSSEDRKTDSPERSPGKLNGALDLITGVLDVAGCPAVLIDADGIIVHAASRAAEMLCAAPGELVNSALFYFIPALEENWPESIHSSQMNEAGRRWQIRNGEGGGRFVSWHVHSAQLDSGEWTLLVLEDAGGDGAVAHTDTATVQISSANERLTESNRQLEKSIQLAERLAQEAHVAGRAKTAFLASLSYEIRTPMNVIVGMLSLLQETVVDTEQADYLSTAEAAAGHLMSVINDIMDLSQIESRRMDFDQVGFDLADLVDSALDGYAMRAQEKGVELTCVIEKDVPLRLVGDPRRLKRLLETFLEYSVAMTDRGEVNIEISLDKRTDGIADIRFLIADTGPGLSPEVISALTGASYAEMSPAPVPSVGFSVTLARQIAQLMGAEISAVNDDRGAAVWFTAAFEVGRGTSSVEIFDNAAFAECEVIVADDNMSARRALALNAMELSRRVRETSTATELATRIHLSKARYSERVTVLVDVDMPAAARALKPGGVLPPHLKLIGLVPRAGFREGQGFVREDFASFLTKPVKRTRLLRTLSRILQNAENDRSVSTPVPQEKPVGENLRTLVVEDNENNQKVARTILRRLGCIVDIAVNGKDALQVMNESEYDLVFMDIQMPIMDGREAARRIREGEASERHRDIPIIAMTAHAFEEDRAECLKAGMNDYLVKPVETEHLRAAIERFSTP